MKTSPKIWIDPKIAHLVPSELEKSDFRRLQPVFEIVERFMTAEGYSGVPTMGDDGFHPSLCEDEGVYGFISGNDWGNVKEVMEEQVAPHGLKVDFVEFMGSAWFKIIPQK